MIGSSNDLVPVCWKSTIWTDTQLFSVDLQVQFQLHVNRDTTIFSHEYALEVHKNDTWSLYFITFKQGFLKL